MYVSCQQPSTICLRKGKWCYMAYTAKYGQVMPGLACCFCLTENHEPWSNRILAFWLFFFVMRTLFLQYINIWNFVCTTDLGFLFTKHCFTVNVGLFSEKAFLFKKDISMFPWERFSIFKFGLCRWHSWQPIQIEIIKITCM